MSVPAEGGKKRKEEGKRGRRRRRSRAGPGKGVPGPPGGGQSIVNFSPTAAVVLIVIAQHGVCLVCWTITDPRPPAPGPQPPAPDPLTSPSPGGWGPPPPLGVPLLHHSPQDIATHCRVFIKFWHLTRLTLSSR